jgi:hypothetical protein
VKEGGRKEERGKEGRGGHVRPVSVARGSGGSAACAVGNRQDSFSVWLCFRSHAAPGECMLIFALRKHS